MEPDVINDLIDVNIASKLNITYKFRATVEMLNDHQGVNSILKRLDAIFTYTDVNITTKNIKRGGKYAAKAIIIGDIDKTILLSWGSYLNNVQNIVDSIITLDTIDENKLKYPKNINVHTIKITFVSPTIGAIIDIIPIIKYTEDGDYPKDFSTEIFDANTGMILESVNVFTDLCYSYISQLKDAKIKRGDINTLLGHIASIVNKLEADDSEMESIVDAMFDKPEVRTIAKSYLRINI